MIAGGGPARAAAIPGENDVMETTAAPVDAELASFIAKIKAVDNHTHVNTTVPNDSESDQLPLELISPFELPARIRPDSPIWVAAYKSIYGYPHAEISPAFMLELQALVKKVGKEHGEKFPEWVLDKIGTEIMLANRVAMGPGLAAPRFAWVPFVDGLIMPLSNKAGSAVTPDRAKLYPALEQLRERYMDELKVAQLPATLDAYVTAIVLPTLGNQRKAGAVAVKFEAALLRSLDFTQVSAETAGKVYARFVKGGEPAPAEYKALQDYLFRTVAREAGRLGLAVHIHAYEAPGNFFQAAGSDPLLLEPTFNDATLRGTRFVLVHGGGSFAAHATAMLWKPNVYVDTSAMALFYSPAQLAEVLRPWLLLFPEKVLFGTDAATLGPGIGWELGAWIGTDTVRRALGIALSEMIRNEEVSRARAEEIATMVMRTNAAGLYKLALK